MNLPKYNPKDPRFDNTDVDDRTGTLPPWTLGQKLQNAMSEKQVEAGNWLSNLRTGVAASPLPNIVKTVVGADDPKYAPLVKTLR